MEVVVAWIYFVGMFASMTVCALVGWIRRDNYTGLVEVVGGSLITGLVWPLMIWPTLGILIAGLLPDRVTQRIRGL